MSENPARRPWTAGMWRVDSKSADKHWTDSLSIIDADGGEVCVLTRGYEGDNHGNGCPSWKNAVLIVSAVNDFAANDDGYLRGLQDAWDAINKWITQGELSEPAHSERNGMVLASNQVMKLITDRNT